MKDGLRECIKEREGRVLLEIEVTPNAPSSEVTGYNEWRKRLQVRVKAKAQDGAANRELLSYFASLFKVKSSGVRILSGEKPHMKTLSVSGVSYDSVLRTLEGTLS